MHTTTPADLDPRRTRGPSFVLRPALLGLMIYGLLLWIAHVWVVATSSLGELEELSTTALLGPITLPMVLGFVHFGWLLLCMRELRLARHSPPGLRRGHTAGALAGVALSLVLLLVAWRFGTLFPIA